ncbi:hypothetical protein FH972_025094 [Carpinus fangiana]|uniref:Uncharacterized protein n=1 Tax=Carpinus fangiana TaxID=176857 RepID=A0A5N6L092_9ROSI|nr:hypothetical protein FH972_025094 [Carpinus fangiana]
MSTGLVPGNSPGSKQGNTPGPYVLRSLLADVALSEDGQQDGIYITCVEFWSKSARAPPNHASTKAPPLTPPQTTTSTSAPPPPNSCTTSSSPATHTTPSKTPPSSSPRASSPPSPRPPPPPTPASSRSSSSPPPAKPPSSATAPQPSTRCPSSALRTAVAPRSKNARGSAASTSAPPPPSSRTMPTATPSSWPASARPSVCSDLEKSDSSLGSRREGQADVQKELPGLPRGGGAEEGEGAGQEEESGEPQEDTNEDTNEEGKTEPKEEAAEEPKEEAKAEPTPTSGQKDSSKSGQPPPDPLRPHIVSPSEDRFLLTMGTTLKEPGIGMFVNLDGDVVPPSLEFSRYPLSLAIDGSEAELESSLEHDHILAVIDKGQESDKSLVIEIQRCDLDPGAPAYPKHELVLPGDATSSPTLHLGVRAALSSKDYVLPDVVQILRVGSIRLQQADAKTGGKPDQKAIQARDKSGAEFAARLSQAHCKTLVWGEKSIWSAARTPLVLKLDADLEAALHDAYSNSTGHISQEAVEQVFNELRGRDPQTELEFISFGYIRQKASLLLFISLASQTYNSIMTYDRDRAVTEDALITGEIDPRVILALLPRLRLEIVTDVSGVWIPSGLIGLVQSAYAERQKLGDSDKAVQPFLASMFPLVKQYLQFWRQKKGFGSIEDESNIFKSVDAALLHVLLILDEDTPQGPAQEGSVRQELNAVVDKGVDCFERAVELLEKFQRLYVLSRLYQSRKMSSQVLSTWQRILDGETDRGGEFADGEGGVRRYLSQIKDRAIVEQYGAWLAKRNPELGVRVFTYDNGRVKFTSEEAISILKQRAPEAVQHLLEHLVFGKQSAQYANDLIEYYLDSVLTQLDSHKESRASLSESYRAYRALQSPKPTYSQFIDSNSIDADWWRNRLRLLQLLGGSHGAASQYDVPSILKRIEPYSAELVPEMIILGGRQGRHQEAIRLLTHGLGDYDTAIRYCVRGGSGTYSTMSSSAEGGAVPTHAEQSELFDNLLAEFFKIEDLNDRITQTSTLLERFAGWFDVSHVLQIVPDDWSVELMSGFLENAFRQLVSERHETAVAKALTSAQNLNISAGLVEKLDGIGAVVDGGTHSGEAETAAS